MTITAKLASTPTGGHGLDDDLLKAIYAEMIRGKSAGLIPALVLLQPETYGASVGNTKQHVGFKVVRLEPVTDAADADRVRMAISDAYESRQSNGQGALDLGEEDARRCLAYLEEWRKEQKLTVKALGEKWREHFGPETSVPGDYRKSGAVPLREFCLTVGALPDETAAPSDGS